ncbi:uncharacterized protein [Onthophagus taurus]|uniref:uncharacterized protein isoform X2 n=1 Tax=Onthophagus taurus TaxID=166361 RepID=UPI0039BE5A5A
MFILYGMFQEMMILLSISIISLLPSRVYSQNEKLLEKCLDSFYVQYCSINRDDTNVLWNLWAITENFITVHTGDNCIGFGFKYHWIFKQIDSDTTAYTFQKYKEQSRLYIPENTVSEGEYNLELTIIHSRVLKPRIIQCAIRLKAAKIIAAISGSNTRTVQDGDTIKLDGSRSYRGGHKRVRFEWKAERIGVPTEPNKGENEFNAVGEKAKFVLQGDINQFWKITLKVTSRSQKNESSSTSILTKIVNSDTPILDTICSQNCPEAGNYKILSTLTINLEVVCYKSCESIVKYVWDTSEVSARTYLVYGEKDSRLTLQYDPSSTAETVNILVFGQYENKTYFGKAVFSLASFSQIPGTAKCSQVSGKVTELTSVIHQKCSPYDDVGTYSILQDIDDENALILAKNVAPEFSVRVSSHSPYPVRFAIEDAFFVQLDDTLLNIKMDTDLPSGYTNTMQLSMDIFSENKPSAICPNPSLLAFEGKVWEACQIINALLPKLFSEETDDASKQYSIKLSTKIMDDMYNYPTEAALHSLIVVLLRLFRPSDEPKDRQYTLSLSYLCKRLATKRQEQLKTKNPLLIESMLVKECRSSG